ncbi:MAG: beta-lactamase family protein [Eubacteriales bacterium]|nr:beta-lactamase family protein [Eubacteriales bacterium]
MDLVTDTRALMIVKQLLDNTSTVKPVIAQTPQKPKFSPSAIQKPFARALPETQGVSSAHISSFLNALKDDGTLDMHGVLILKNGKMIAEATFGAYDQKVWHITHSECKSITGLAVGMLIDEGKLTLDDRIIDLFASRVSKISQFTHRAMTIRHLLTMTSGVTFNEAGSVTETDWIKCFLESAVLKEPGTTFQYNSMNTYLLACVIKQVSGQGLVDYLKPRLFEPLGITNFYWETCPMGNEKGGWGLYILPEDIAKIGQLVLDGGRFEGKQLVSEQWIAEATRAQVQPPKTLGNYDYGYQTWVGRNERSFLFNGMFGQNVLGFFENGTLLVSNAGNNELFQQSNYYELATRYFGAQQPAGETGKILSLSGAGALQSAKKHLTTVLEAPKTALFGDLFDSRQKLSLSDIGKRLDNRAYFASGDKRAASIGVLPLYAQTLQNNFTKGLHAISFTWREGALSVILDETDERHVLPIGFDEPARAEFLTHGESYIVAVNGRFAADETGLPVLTIRISFLEAANARLVKIRFFDGRIETQWSEFPGKAYLNDTLTEVKGQSALLSNVLERADEELLRFRITRILEPQLTLLERGQTL